ncbi:MAG: type II toxin-antitoxin system VapC family toxin [Alphaproteobacteria bacterium]|nr:type II toxin-antitoxin system VapC family toxin [Alphaproteobacteria bacterium]
MPPVFLDTGYILALEISNDQHHRAASVHWQRVSQEPLNLVTTSLVLNEAVTFLNSRGYHSKAVSVGNALLESPSVDLTHVDEALLLDGWKYFERHHDKRYSLTDCVSFILMNISGIQVAYAFDRNFVQAGFTIEPQRSD